MISEKELKKNLHYDPETGMFTWIAVKQKVVIGSAAGSMSNGYVYIKIRGRQLPAHRLAFTYMTGNYPTKDIDHKNGVRSDNRWSNLRLATKSQNQYNVGLTKRNSSGFKGINLIAKTGKWVAKCSLNGSSVHLGTFETPEDASAAYQDYAKQLHGRFFRVI